MNEKMLFCSMTDSPRRQTITGHFLLTNLIRLFLLFPVTVASCANFSSLVTKVSWLSKLLIDKRLVFRLFNGNLTAIWRESQCLRYH